jgi:hypothetical protein
LTTLLTKEQAQKLKDIELQNINETFIRPTLAYIHGEDVQLMKELGGDLYFSNYWYGAKNDALKFAEQLAVYFKTEYERVGKRDPTDYDFFGMVMYWENGSNAMVGNINLDDEFSFWGYDSGVPDSIAVPGNLKRILFDGNDNSFEMIEIELLSKKEQKELAKLIIDDCKEDYLGMLEEQE